MTKEISEFADMVPHHSVVDDGGFPPMRSTSDHTMVVGSRGVVQWKSTVLSITIINYHPSLPLEFPECRRSSKSSYKS